MSLAEDHIRAVIQEVAPKELVPGMGALLVRGSETLVKVAEGVRKLGSTAKITVDDHFHLGSITKPIGGMLLACLISDGTIKWTTNLGQVFPELFEPMDIIKGVKPGYKASNIEQLMTHSAGFPSSPSNDPQSDYETVDKLLGGNVAMKRLVYLRHALHDEPVADHPYGSGGIIAAAVAEKRTGETWEELMKSRLFGPLGITNFSTHEKSDIFLHKLNEATGKTVAYSADVYEQTSGAKHWAFAPTGQLAIGLSDLAKLVSAFVTSDPKLIAKPAGWTQAFSPPAGAAAARAGWGIEGNLLWHSGAYEGYFAELAFDPTTGLVSFAAGNSLLPGADVATYTIRHELHALGRHWAAVPLLANALPVDASVVTVKSNSAFGEKVVKELSDRRFETVWTAPSKTPTITVRLFGSNAITGLALCETEARIASVDLVIDGATRTFAQLEVTRTDGVLRLDFGDTLQPKTIVVKVKQSSKAPMIARVLVLHA